jgi:hypothetical protein
MIVALVRSIAIGMLDPAGTLNAARRLEVISLSPCLPSAADGATEAFDFRVAQVNVGHPEKSGYRLLRRVAKVGADHVREHIFARGLCWLGGIVYVARSIFPVLDESLLTEDSEHGANGGIRGRIRKVGHDLGHSGARAPMKDVHHLSLATRERGGGSVQF